MESKQTCAVKQTTVARRSNILYFCLTLKKTRIVKENVSLNCYHTFLLLKLKKIKITVRNQIGFDGIIVLWNWPYVDSNLFYGNSVPNQLISSFFINALTGIFILVICKCAWWDDYPFHRRQKYQWNLFFSWKTPALLAVLIRRINYESPGL